MAMYQDHTEWRDLGGGSVVRARSWGNALEMDPEDVIGVQFTASGLWPVFFRWKVKDLLRRYTPRVIPKSIGKQAKFLESGYVYAPYIPMIASPMMRETPTEKEKREFRAKDRPRVESIEHVCTKFRTISDLRYTGAARYSCPLQYEWECRACGATGHVEGLTGIEVLEGYKEVLKRPGLYTPEEVDAAQREADAEDADA